MNTAKSAIFVNGPRASFWSIYIEDELVTGSFPPFSLDAAAPKIRQSPITKALPPAESRIGGYIVAVIEAYEQSSQKWYAHFPDSR